LAIADEIHDELGPRPANQVLAIVQTAVFEAANAITRRYPAGVLQLEAAPAASVDAAIAAANRATLVQLVPSQQAAIDTAYQRALAMIADGPEKTAGIAVGEKAAMAILALRIDDGAATEEAYGRTPPRESTCQRSSQWARIGHNASRG
jgi:hypothetical protein